MKYLNYFLFFMLTSCATLPYIKNAPEQKIEQNQERLNDNASKILEVVKKELSKLKDSNNQKESTINEISRQLTYAQAALGMTTSDVLTIPDSNLEAYVQTLQEENSKLIEKNSTLESKVKEQNNINNVSKIQKEAVDDDHAASRRKWYAILAIIVVAIGTFVYFFPASSFSLVKSIFMK